ncbi:hypothetical protein ACKKBG_A20940 [Auxenochlorella protothecoides x Auxenochlorella symbiontica]|uniref:Uncharacterized protein n=1 Tax=Auxenochlorella protothecoides TaxID=3075 RepID=A0A087SKJ6_AUXPR|nr:hypothetical protein F751_4743 [Auxenochlorella protothecoides]KFM26250.1 hypothetical protein F751_4743 [Auxenochlorella protothecoides]RMZ56725.1 hypothetical protein APUTEX25_002814 [Auxenochlorella protothecoides]|eukprot:RMZ56725.1 hypothetical protein APUTEX25_002814 [Auxenochlorella protothecoides]
MKMARGALFVLFASMLVASAVSRKLLADGEGPKGVVDTIAKHTFHGELSDSLDAFIGNLSEEFQGFIDSLHDGHKDFFKFKKGKKPIFTLDPPEVEGPAAEFDD